MLGPWDTEEVGCQAHEKFSLGERIVGNCFPKVKFFLYLSITRMYLYLT
jgi:hypothetical protein